MTSIDQISDILEKAAISSDKNKKVLLKVRLESCVRITKVHYTETKVRS